jgi:hypothetical protein
MNIRPSRREFLEAAGAVGGLLFPYARLAADNPRKKVAAIVVEYHLRSHADNLVTRLLEGYWINDEFHPPSCQVSSVYVHQTSKTDVSWRLAEAYGFRRSPTIADALTLGTGSLAVDAVLIVAESASDLIPYEKNPYKEFFSQMVDVFKKSGRSVPVLNDKDLSSDWTEAQWMVEQSRELHFPLMAGSSIPITFRRPELDFPLGTRFEEALVATGLPRDGVESMGFHGLELLQAMVERRAGGETGVRAVQCLEGAAVWEAARQGVWSRALFDAAVSRSPTRFKGRPEDLIAEPKALLVEYRDGLKGAVIDTSGLAGGFNFAARLQEQEQIQSTMAYFISENSNNFSCEVYHFERMMETGKTDWPIERNLLTAGMLDFLMRSRRADHKRLETPQLNVTYQAPAVSVFCRGPGS